MRRKPTVAGKKAPKRSREPLPPRKGEELIGVALLVLALLLAVSVITYHPSDPTFLHLIRGTSGGLEPAPEIGNFIGPVGANLAEAMLALMGVTAILVSVLLLVAAGRRVRRHSPPRIVGRGFGAGLLLVSLPILLQLVFREIEWRGEGLDAGGLIGRLGVAALETGLGFVGSLLVLLGLVAAGAALFIQSSLGDVLSAVWRRVVAAWERMRLAIARRRQRQDKKRAKLRVVEKQLKRAGATGRKPIGRRRPIVTTQTAEPARITEKAGKGGFSLRRVEVAEPAPVEKAASRRKPPQPTLPFAADESRPASLPPLNLLSLDPIRLTVRENKLVQLGETLRQRCDEFGVEGTIEGISPGPVITTFEFQPAPGVKVSQIVNLQDDLALVLKAESVRIERLAGRSTLGIEVPNDRRSIIHLGHLLAGETFQNSPSLLTMAIGTTIHGEPYYSDLATMPHVLVAGATGSGKSVGLQSMITSLVYKATREQVQFIFIDPKRIELGVYKDIPHLKTEVVMNPKKAANALRWAVAEMERRYRLLAEVHVRSIDFYNQVIRDPEVQQRLSLTEGEETQDHRDLATLPYYVIVIDELADLMMVASSEVETSIARLAQMARAVGIHLIVATQRPSVDVLTGTIKANFPCRIAFATASRHDSRTILDQVGAERLLGKGDMLFMPPGTSRVIRLHGAYVSEQETAALVRWMKKQGKPELDPEVLKAPEEPRSGRQAGGDEDELFDDAARLVVAERQASASFLQRRMRIGFSRAARLIDMMERDGLLGPPQGSKPREVLVKADFFAEWAEARRSSEA